MYCTLELWNQWWNDVKPVMKWKRHTKQISYGNLLRLSNFRKFDGKSLIRAWSGVTDIAQINICDPWCRVLLSNFLKLDNRSRNPWNQWFHDWRETSDFITCFITLGYSTLVQQIYWLLKILLVYALKSTVLLECVQLNSWFITIKFYFSCTGLNRAPQE